MQCYISFEVGKSTLYTFAWFIDENKKNEKKSIYTLHYGTIII